MRTMLRVTALAAIPALALLMSPGAARAGCLTGAAVGGVAGHYAGHHAVLGAAAGCAIGHHQAVVKHRQERAAADAAAHAPPAPF